MSKRRHPVPWLGMALVLVAWLFDVIAAKNNYWPFFVVGSGAAILAIWDIILCLRGEDIEY